jgi:hypothetical protein
MEAFIYGVAVALFLVLMLLPARQHLEHWPSDCID